MEKKELHELLKKLHLELEHIQSTDEDFKGLLKNISDDINQILSQEEHGSSESHLSLNNRLRLAIQEFDVTHPQISATMKQLIDTLSNMGI